MHQSTSEIWPSSNNTLSQWLFYVLLFVAFLCSMLILYPAVHPLVFTSGFVFLLLTLYFPEIPLVAFVFIGVTKPWIDKNIPLFQSIDYTIFLSAFLVILLAITTVRRKTYMLPHFYHFLPFLIVFSVLLFLGVTYSSAPRYGFEKSARFFAFNIPLFITTILYIKEPKDIKRIFVVIVCSSFLFATIMLYNGLDTLMKGDLKNLIVRMTILGANPIASARIFSLSFLILFITAFYVQDRRRKTVFYLLSAYFLLSLLVTNTRGPVLATLIAALVFLMFLSGMSTKRIIIYFGILTAAVVLAMFILPEFVIKRYEFLLEMGAKQKALYQGEINTIESRTLMWSMAFLGMFDSFWTFVLGHGTGSFLSLFHFSDFLRLYPHNIIAEIAYELGAIGLMIFLIHLWQILRCIGSVWNKAKQLFDFRSITTIAIVTTVSAFVSALVSGDLSDNRFLWFHFGLIVACWRILKNIEI